jgi:hypothetical protein
MFNEEDNGREETMEEEVVFLPLSARVFVTAAACAKGTAAQLAIVERMIVLESFMVSSF